MVEIRTFRSGDVCDELETRTENWVARELDEARSEELKRWRIQEDSRFDEDERDLEMYCGIKR